MLTDTVKNVRYFRSCVGDQFVGSLLNDIIGKIESSISSPLNGIMKILQFVSFGVSSVGSFIDGLKIQTLFGGSVIEEGSSFSSRNTPHVICGCPGRVFDMMRRDKIGSKSIKIIIHDEADEMLSSGFKEQVYNIFQYLSNDIQVCLFSATLPDSINTIVEKIMRNPVRVCVKREQLTLEGIKQYFVAVDDDRQKYSYCRFIL